MKTSAVISIFTAALASATTVKYDQGYDDASRSLTAVACSDGANGLITKYGWQTQGNVAGFPNIGASDLVGGWNSPNCGACLQVSYNGNTINVLAVDHADNGLVLSEAALNTLTNGQAEAFGFVDASVTQVDVGQCGIGASKRSAKFRN